MKQRRLAREMAVQCLYQMEMNEVSEETAIAMILEEARQEEPEAGTGIKDVLELRSFVSSLVDGTTNNKTAINGLLVDYLKGWQVDRLSRVDRQILRLAAFEMVFMNDTPAKVVINEAIELAKHFGTDESGKFVNGVLGKMIKEIEQIKAKTTLQ